MAATAEREPVRVKPSKRQTRRKRRLRFAASAAKVSREEVIRGSGPTIAATPDFHMAKSCGFDPLSREMRRREPPTRSRNSELGRLNRPNGWHMPGDSKTLVTPKEGAGWLWWLSLGDDAQDEVYELSMKCSDRSDGIGHVDADPLELLRDMPKEKRSVVLEGESAKDWGRR